MPGRHAVDVDVPEVEGPVDARVERDRLDRLGRVVALEDEQLDARRVPGEQREVRALGVGRRPERMRAPGSDGEATRRSVLGRGDRGGHDVAPSAIGGSRSTRFSFACLVSSATIARPLRVSARPSGLPSSCGQLPDLVRPGHGIADDQFPDPGDRLRLVAEQVEAPVRSDLEVAEVLAVGRQLDRRVPDGERDEDVIAIVGRPARAGLERGLRSRTPTARRPSARIRRRPPGPSPWRSGGGRSA